MFNITLFLFIFIFFYPSNAHFTRRIFGKFAAEDTRSFTNRTLLLYSLDMAGTGRRSLEFHGIGHMDTVETENSEVS